MRQFVTAVFAAFLAAPAGAADITPGLWEISMESRSPATPGFTPPPFKLSQCITPADAKDPSRVLGQVANPGATNCTYGERNYSGNTLTFTMKCAGSLALESSGRIAFSATTMEGTIDARANLGGQSLDMQNKLSARRVGGC
jgi:hypothetical protein